MQQQQLGWALFITLVSVHLSPAEAQALEMTPTDLAWRISLCIILVGLAAVFSGLTLAVMSQDPNQLRILMEAGTPREKRQAERIMMVRKDGNLLLCTLLWSNMGVNSLLSVTMAGMGGELVGVLVSTPLLVLFGEIIPQATCSRHALVVGSWFSGPLQFVIFLLYPVSKPIALALDYFLGEEIGTLYSKREMQSLLQMHVLTNVLHPREAAIMAGAITFRDRLIRDVATPANRMFALKSSDRLDYRLMTQIYRTGYSRIPVWNDEETAIVGVLYAKDLMLVNPTARLPTIAVVHFFGRQHLNVVDDEDTLETALRLFQSTRQHFAIVRTVDSSVPDRDPTYKIAGVVSMEDVVEAVWGEEILDEFDVMRSSTSDGLDSTSGSSLDASEPRAFAPSKPNSAASQQQPGAQSGPHTSVMVAGGSGGSGQEGQRLLDSAGGGASGGHGRSQSIGGSPGGPRKHPHGLRGGSVDGGKNPLQVAREEAALRRMREVAINDLQGRGVNNDLTGQEVRALAAHLLYNVTAFRPVVAAAVAPVGPLSPTPAGRSAPDAPVSIEVLPHHLTFDMVERLVRQSDVIDVLAPWTQKHPPGMAVHTTYPHAQQTHGQQGSSSADTALVDPTQFGASLLRSMHHVNNASEATLHSLRQQAPAEGGRSDDLARLLVAASLADAREKAAGVANTAVSDGEEDKAALYLRGEPSAVCTIILQGSMELRAGNDAIVSEKGPWDVLAERALTAPRGSYAPDFSARPLTPLVRCLRITRADYDAAVLGTLPDLRFGDDVEDRGLQGGGATAAAAAASESSDAITAAARVLRVGASPTGVSRADSAYSSYSTARPTANSSSSSGGRTSTSAVASSNGGGVGERDGDVTSSAGMSSGSGSATSVAATIGSSGEWHEREWRERRATTLPPTPFSEEMEQMAPTIAPMEGGRPATGPAPVAMAARVTAAAAAAAAAAAPAPDASPNTNDGSSSVAVPIASPPALAPSLSDAQLRKSNSGGGSGAEPSTSTPNGVLRHAASARGLGGSSSAATTASSSSSVGSRPPIVVLVPAEPEAERSASAGAASSVAPSTTVHSHGPSLSAPQHQILHALASPPKQPTRHKPGRGGHEATPLASARHDHHHDGGDDATHSGSDASAGVSP